MCTISRKDVTTPRSASGFPFAVYQSFLLVLATIKWLTTVIVNSQCNPLIAPDRKLDARYSPFQRDH